MQKILLYFSFLLAFTLNAEAIAEEMEGSSCYLESKNEIKIPIYAGIDGFLVTMPDVIYLWILKKIVALEMMLMMMQFVYII
jgi:hypothetical protein